MSTAMAVLAFAWAGLTAYALLGGADFGGGLWDLLAGRRGRGAAQRSLIAHSIGPVWEANHVWLIFVLVLLWTGFPGVFAAIASTCYIPLTLAALGIIGRGAAFAFRKADTPLSPVFTGCFAASSLLTPFFLGTVAGAVASGRVPPGLGAGDPVGSWVNPTSLVTGLLAVGVGGYLAAVYLAGDARRHRPELVAAFRRRALVAGLVVGAVALAGLLVVRADAPRLWAGLTGPALPLVAVSVVAGVGSLVLLVARRHTLVRLTGAVAVAALLWGWALAQYPVLLEPRVTVRAAAAPPATLTAMLIALVVGVVLLVPALGWLFALFQSTSRRARPAGGGDPPRPGVAG